MTLWEFSACREGYELSQGHQPKSEGEGMSEDRMRDLGIL